MNIQKQAFSAHYRKVPDDYRIVCYSDINCANLHAHSHDYYEMFYLVSGRILYCTGGCKFFLQPDDILFINCGQSHHPILVEPSVPYERILLQVAPQTLQALSAPDIDLSECFTHNNLTVYHYPRDVRNNIRRLFDQLSSLPDSGVFGHRVLGRAYLMELFVEINQYNHNKDIFSFGQETKNAQIIRMVQRYVCDHVGETITVDNLAEHLYMSRWHLMRQFKQNAGVPVYQFIIKTRLEMADALVQEGRSYTEASQLCGFGDYSSYYRAFLREYGISPRDYYRKNRREHQVLAD